jgi:hypothetical protein
MDVQSEQQRCTVRGMLAVGRLASAKIAALAAATRDWQPGSKLQDGLARAA